MNIVKRQGGINTILIYVGIGIGVVNTFLRARAITAEEIGVISTITTLAGDDRVLHQLRSAARDHPLLCVFRERIRVKSSYVVFVLIIQIALLVIGVS